MIANEAFCMQKKQNFMNICRLSASEFCKLSEDSSKQGKALTDKVSLDMFLPFLRSKWKVLQLSWGSHQYHYRLGVEWFDSSPVEKDLGILSEFLALLLDLFGRAC